MSLRLHLERRSTLPPLAWCAHVAPGSAAVRVLHGEGVETREDGFVEGAWAGDFERFDLVGASVRCGTGGVLRAGRIAFCPATDRQCPIYSIAGPRGLFVSNSPMFAMVAAGEEPDPIHPFYSYRILSFWRAGLYCASGALPLASGRTLRVHMAHVLEVDPRGRRRLLPPDPGPVPVDYASYRALLAEGVARVIENAGSPHRARCRYEPLAAISRGYDSVACAVFAAEAGCREALTFFDRGRRDPHADDGSENARALGMRCTRHDRWAHLEGGGDPRAEAETGWFAHSSVAWSAAAPRLAGHLLVTGRPGGLAWLPKFRQIDRLAHPASPYPGLMAASELRLRMGFQLLSPATIAMQHAREVHRIAWSDALRPWSVGGAYDKPVARRIIEEAGIPRDGIAARSIGTAHVHLNRKGSFSEKGWADYRSFVAASHAEVPAWRRAFWRRAVEARYTAWRRLGSTRPRATSRWVRTVPFLASRLPENQIQRWEYLFTLSWSFQVVRDRYEGPIG